MPRRTYGVTIDVPEELVEKLLSRGMKPSEVISQVIMHLTSDVNTDQILGFAKTGNISALESGARKEKDRPAGGSGLAGREWTYPLFERYIEGLVSLAERRASVGDLLSMLVAYLRTSSRPTSEELREARGFGPGDGWYEELRTSKTRLTIAAKSLGLPSFFLRAYGSGLRRRHPMSEDFYRFLQKWVSGNKVVVEEYEKRATPRAVE